MSAPFFSIVIINHNYERFLAQAIESALAQTFGVFLSEALTTQRIHGKNAFTLNPNNKIARAKRTILGAYWLKKRIPQTEHFSDRLMAKGLAYSLHARWKEAWYDDLIEEYLRPYSHSHRAFIYALSYLYFFIKTPHF